MSGTICWIAHRDVMNPASGGAEKSILEICRGLRDLGWQVELLSAGFPGSLPDEPLDGLTVHRGSGRIGLHLELPRMLKKIPQPQVIVEDLGHVVPFLVRGMTESPVVVFFRHLHRRTLPGQVGFPAGLIFSVIELCYPYLYRHTPVVAPSSSAEADLCALGFSRSQISRIGYGVDSELFKPLSLTPTPTLIFFAGLRAYKRPDHAIHVLRLLRDANIDATLSIVGRGPEQPGLAALANKLGLTRYIRFTGWLAQEELAALLGESWIHIQCSLAEGWGLTCWEAAAAGVPTVAYDVPGLNDSVVPGYSGILVRNGDVSALAGAAMNILSSRESWTHRCRSTVEGHSWREAAKKWSILLQGVAGRSSCTSKT